MGRVEGEEGGEEGEGGGSRALLRELEAAKWLAASQV